MMESFFSNEMVRLVAGVLFLTILWYAFGHAKTTVFLCSLAIVVTFNFVVALLLYFFCCRHVKAPKKNMAIGILLVLGCLLGCLLICAIYPPFPDLSFGNLILGLGGLFLELLIWPLVALGFIGLIAGVVFFINKKRLPLKIEKNRSKIFMS